ncbi:MAG: hypothetical protein SCALA702_02310 [Melioribacteraceae bacterium]|nr:MAG: hypothetical protein SCALA702_02310 [Melioribacteraceae bacterium]
MRNELVKISLDWQHKYGVAPQITTVISEYDAAMLIGMTEVEYSTYMQEKTAVTKGYDFIFSGIRYQIKANRPSGKKGSKVSRVPKAANYYWDKLIWVLYNKFFEIQEVWEWDVHEYKDNFDKINRLTPQMYRNGKCLFSVEEKL